MQDRTSNSNGMGVPAPLTALAILPNRGLAQPFFHAMSESHAFQIDAEWVTYPPASKLELQLRQGRPQVLLIDVSANLAEAVALIEATADMAPSTPVIALHSSNDAHALLECLRAGAKEFLYAPFTPEMQRQAAARIASLWRGNSQLQPDADAWLYFRVRNPAPAPPRWRRRRLSRCTRSRASASCWSTSRSRVARCGCSLSCRRPPGRRTTVVRRRYPASHGGDGASLVQRKGGVDVLPAPAELSIGSPDPAKLRKILECARPVYDWTIVDLPTVFDRLSLLILPESEHAFLVTTPELPSLHLTRKAVSLLAQIGLGLQNFNVIVNRATKADDVTLEAMAKIFKAPIYASFPNDYLSLHKALSAGQPIGPCALERALWDFARSICSKSQGTDRRRRERPAESRWKSVSGGNNPC